MRLIAATVAVVAVLVALQARQIEAQEVVTLDSPSPLVRIRIMVKVGSAHDPAGQEGLAGVTARALLEGGFGESAEPVTKERLAEITQPLGEGAQPRAMVAKETTTLVMTVPRAALDEYLERVLRPLLGQPLFDDDEVARIVRETRTSLTGGLRFEQLELAGLEALDNYIFDGTTYGHSVLGTAQGLDNVTAADVRRFFATHYRPEAVILGLTTREASIVDPVREAVGRLSRGVRGDRLAPRPLAPPASVHGRELTIVALPNAGAAGLHAGFPIEVGRTHEDYWPLYVANVYFGTHRDSHGQLFQRLRAERGYNYGNYSYIEHFAFRPFSLFPPFNTPRRHQYFSIWIRPAATAYAHHLLKAMTWELDNLVRTGIAEAEVERTKNKARVLYLNLADTTDRLLAAKMDDAYYGLAPGYLEGYLAAIDAVTADQVNAAIRRHLQAAHIKFLIVTDASHADQLAEDVRLNRNARGKGPADYNLSPSDGGMLEVDAAMLRTIERDAVWEHYWMDIDPARIRVVPISALFETGRFVADTR